MPRDTNDIFHAVVVGDIERAEEIQEAADAAKDMAPLLYHFAPGAGNALVAEVVTRGAVAAASRMAKQKRVAAAQTAREAAALKQADVTTVSAVTDDDVAEERAQRIQRQEGA